MERPDLEALCRLRPDDALTGSNPPWTKERRLAAGWLRIQSVNRVFALTLTIVKALNIMYVFEKGTPIKGQDADIYKVIHRCPYLNLFGQVLQTIGFEGLCCVIYKVAHGQPFLLEINPRFGGSLGRYFFSFLRHLN